MIGTTAVLLAAAPGPNGEASCQMIVTPGATLWRHVLPQALPLNSSVATGWSVDSGRAFSLMEGSPLAIAPRAVQLTLDEHQELIKGLVPDRILQVLWNSTPAAVPEVFPCLREYVGNLIMQGAVVVPEPPELPEAAEAAPPPPGTGLRYNYPEIRNGTVVRPNGEPYHVRRIGGQDDVGALRRNREAGGHALAFGRTGTGKGAMFEAAFGERMVTINGTEDTETADFLGGYVQRGDGSWHWVDGPLLQAMEGDGEEGYVLFVDELGAIRSRQLKVLYPLMDGRSWINITMNPERGVVRARPGFAIVAAMNPDSPGVRIDPATMSRFGLQFDVPTDYTLMRSRLGVDGELVQAAMNLQTRMRSEGDISWTIEARHMLTFMTNKESIGLHAALGSLVNGAPKQDRRTVAEVLSRSYGMKVSPLAVD